MKVRLHHNYGSGEEGWRYLSRNNFMWSVSFARKIAFCYSKFYVLWSLVFFKWFRFTAFLSSVVKAKMANPR